MSLNVDVGRREIPDFPGYYATVDGQIIGRRRHRPLRPETITGGYKRVCILRFDGAEKHVLVHRAVIAAFEGPCPAGYQVNHKNGDPADNRYANLEYLTPSENVQHGVNVLGHNTCAPGERHPHARFTNAMVHEMRSLWGNGTPISEIAQKFSTDYTNAWRIVTRRAWKHLP